MITDVKILAVDDVEMNLEILEVMLSGHFSEFIKASNGQAALDILAATSDIDIILLDLEMPVLDGFATLSLLKRNDSYREIPVIVITANKSDVLKTLSLGANDFLAKPYDKEELKLRVMNHVRSKKLADMQKDLNAVLEREVVKKTADLRKALTLSQEAEYEISIRLGKAAEFRDLETGMHTRRISELSFQLASLLGLPEAECELLRFASPLHDVGKIGIPDRILLKPGKLDETEFQIMKLHTVIGGKIMSEAGRYPLLEAGRIVALQHHEKWDGSGYPNGIKGEEIHVFARIVMIVDIFDALTSERPYKKAFTIDESIAIMADGKGEFFDPTLLDIFLTNIDLFVSIKEALKDTPSEQAPLEEIVQLT
jgi:putative two-component system response regulator